MSKHIKANGEVLEVRPKSGTTFTLEEMQGYVGGYIEMVQRLRLGREFLAPGVYAEIGPEHVLVVNEEGKIRGLTLNKAATSVFAGGVFDHIVGDVLLCTREEAGFENTGGN